jgi:hypothetical protein
MRAPPYATRSKRPRPYPNPPNLPVSGLGWIPPPFFVPGVVFMLLGLALLTASQFFPRNSGAPERPDRLREFIERLIPQRPAIAVPAASSRGDVELTGPVTRHERAMRWPLLIDPDTGPLHATERRRIIEGLAVVGDAWCASVLATAYTDESDELRETVIDAIGRCDGDVIPTLERGLRSHRVPERYAAVDAASRRGFIELLERGIKDTDGTVALAAAYGLMRAKRRDLVDFALLGRDDVRANEIRRVLPVLT